eukprot:3230119-Rhodomonas_salina.1
MSRSGSCDEGAGLQDKQANLDDGISDADINAAKRGREASPQEHRAKRVKTEDVSEPPQTTDRNAELHPPERFRNPALDARRREKTHQSTARQAQSIGLVFASDFGEAIDGCIFSCVAHQYALQTENGSSARESRVSKITGVSNLKELCSDWLLSNKDTNLVPPPPLASSAYEDVDQIRDPDKMLTRTMTQSVTSAVKSQSIDDFAVELMKDQPRLTKETVKLVAFACSNVLKMRIAVLQPSRRSDAMWELWDPGVQDSGGHIVLTIAQPRPGSNVFESLVDKDSAPEFIPDDDVTVHSEEEEIEPRAGPSHSQEIPLFWRRCIACDRIRWMFQSDNQPETESWTCDQNITSSVENNCEDFPVWNEILKFWNELLKPRLWPEDAQKNQRTGSIKLRRFHAPNKTLAGKRVDMSKLFVAVQAFNTAQDIHHANGLQTLVDMRKATPLVTQWLGVSAKSNGRAKHSFTSALKKIYERVFVSSKLETILLAIPEVQATIQHHKHEIFSALDVDPGLELPQPQLPFAPVPLFQQRDLTKRFSSYEVRKLLSRFRDSAATWLADHNQNAPWYTPLQNVVDEVQRVLHGGDVNALILLGDTNVGKSRLLDLLLWISESDKN